MLFVRYVHLTKAKAIIREKPVLSSGRMLHKLYDHRGSVVKKEKKSGSCPRGVLCQDELISGKPPVVK
jgi:hypothetical protein